VNWSILGKCLQFNDESADVKNDHSGVICKTCSLVYISKNNANVVGFQIEFVWRVAWMVVWNCWALLLTAWSLTHHVDRLLHITYPRSKGSVVDMDSYLAPLHSIRLPICFLRQEKPYFASILGHVCSGKQSWFLLLQFESILRSALEQFGHRYLRTRHRQIVDENHFQYDQVFSRSSLVLQIN